MGPGHTAREVEAGLQPGPPVSEANVLTRLSVCVHAHPFHLSPSSVTSKERIGIVSLVVERV